MDDISMPELVRLHKKLEDEVKELYNYAHANGHEINNIKNILPFHITKIEDIKKDLDEMKKAIEFAENSPAGRELLTSVEIATDLSKSNNRVFEKHERQIDQLRRFMWMTIGATAVFNVVIPLLAKYFLK